MKKIELEGVYAMACSAKGFKPNDTQFRVWWKTLGSLERAQLEQALIAWFTSHEDFPMPSALRENVALVKRENKPLTEKHQQQVCPRCNSLVGMARPIGDQFRTWCSRCQCYRKIVPEDMELTQAEWSLLCSELELVYQQWVTNGRRYDDCIDPQFDRARIRGAA